MGNRRSTTAASGERASRGKKRMMVSVVMSSATRVPEMSLLLSTLLRQPTTYRGPLLALTMTARTAAFLLRLKDSLPALHCRARGVLFIAADGKQ